MVSSTSPNADGPEESDSARSGLLATIAQAMRGGHHDFTRGSLHRAIFLLALPMMLEMAMESLFAVCDIFFLGGLKNTAALATVGLTETMLTLVYAVAIGLSMATTAMVARRVGQKRPEDAARVAAQAVFMGLAAALVVGAIGVLFAPNLLRFMGADQEVVQTGSTYTRILLGSNVVIFLLFLLNAIFRGAGDAAVAMRSLWLANAINIALDPLLIFGLGPVPALGLQGAAIATTIGRGIGVLYQLRLLCGGTARIHVTAAMWRFDRALSLDLLRIARGGVFQFLVGTASWIALIRIAASFGKEAVAGYTVAVRIVIFGFLPAFGLSNAAATLVGQNLGAGQPDRAERSVWWTGFYNMVFLTLVMTVFLVFHDAILGVFLDRGNLSESDGTPLSFAAVREVAVKALCIMSFGFPFYAWQMVSMQAFNGAGDTNTPTFMNLACFWALQIPLGWTLARHTSLGVAGVFWSVAICYSVSAVLGMAMFRRGTWKTRQV